MFSKIVPNQQFLVGVVSAGPQCGMFDYYPGIYGKVENYIDWIREKVDA